MSASARPVERRAERAADDRARRRAGPLRLGLASERSEHRVPGSFTGLRFVMAAAAGAVFVTEPYEGPTPFTAGVDHVEAPAGRLAEAIGGILRDEARARRIVEAAQALLRGDLAMGTCLGRLTPLSA